MFVSLQNILSEGEKRNCAIPACNVYNLETAMGVANAAAETGAPVIFQMYSRLFDGQTARYLAPSIIQIAKELPVPAAFHLDHGAGFDQVMRALYYGANSIMIDASTLTLEENIKKTKTVVDLCEAVGVGVEGELGHIGTTAETLAEYTQVDEAERYVRETGVKALAIMVGTAHGRYKQAPVINVKRINEIRHAVHIPLVLHGGSGVPDDQIRASIEAGIRKINFGTDLCYSFLDAVFETPRDVFAVDLFMKEAVAAVNRFAESKIRLLGAHTNG
jgi:fructose-bisphosphate aldolase class II